MAENCEYLAAYVRSSGISKRLTVENLKVLPANRSVMDPAPAAADVLISTGTEGGCGRGTWIGFAKTSPDHFWALPPAARASGCASTPPRDWSRSCWKRGRNAPCNDCTNSWNGRMSTSALLPRPTASGPWTLIRVGRSDRSSKHPVRLPSPAEGQQQFKEGNIGARRREHIHQRAAPGVVDTFRL